MDRQKSNNTTDKIRGPHILLVEDEETLAEGIEYNLRKAGYSVAWVKDGQQALEYYETQAIDLILLDIMIPYVNGFEVARQIRQKSPQLPILMLTAKTALKDRVHGLEIGADDYLTKPFHLAELLARIKAMLRRKAWYQSAVEDVKNYRFGDNEINFADFSARHGKNRFQLTPLEAMVMKYLIQNRGKVVSRQELLEKVWNIDPAIETRTVDNFIARLRKYFEPDAKNPIHIKSIRGAGYLFRD